MRRPRGIAAFDLETTGPDPFHDRIVTACVLDMDMAGNILEKRTWVVWPGIPIPTGASDVHGYTTERVLDMAEEGTARTDYSRVVFDIMQYLNILDRRAYATVVYNAPFDLTMLGYELERCHPGIKYTAPTYVVDPLVIDKAIDPYRRGSRKLSDVAAHYGVPVGDAHQAEADCIMAAGIALKLLEWPKSGRNSRPLREQSIDEIHTRQIAAKRAQSESFAEYLVKMARSGYSKKEGRPLTEAEITELLERAQEVRPDWPYTPVPRWRDNPENGAS